MVLNRLPTIMIEPLVRAALLEDLGQAGDLTSDAIVPATLATRAAFKARQAGVIAGLDLASLAFRLLDEKVTISCEHFDGEQIRPGQTIGIVQGSARAILSAERTSLNFLCG
jgi:nicotinate-nucleotide pyrophosphorylase (carboxylating)